MTRRDNRKLEWARKPEAGEPKNHSPDSPVYLVNQKLAHQNLANQKMVHQINWFRKLRGKGVIGNESELPDSKSPWPVAQP